MLGQLSGEHLAEIISIMQNEDINFFRGADKSGDTMFVFDGTSDTREVENLLGIWLDGRDEEYPDLKDMIKKDIIYAIGEYGYADQFTCCDGCYLIIDMYDHAGGVYTNDGELLCEDCEYKNETDHQEEINETLSIVFTIERFVEWIDMLEDDVSIDLLDGKDCLFYQFLKDSVSYEVDFTVGLTYVRVYDDHYPAHNYSLPDWAQELFDYYVNGIDSELKYVKVSDVWRYIDAKGWRS